MKKKYIPTKFNLVSLSELLNDLKSVGIKPEDYKEVNFELNYDACYYESDVPSISAVLSKKLIEKLKD